MPTGIQHRESFHASGAPPQGMAAGEHKHASPTDSLSFAVLTKCLLRGSKTFAEACNGLTARGLRHAGYPLNVVVMQSALTAHSLTLDCGL